MNETTKEGKIAELSLSTIEKAVHGWHFKAMNSKGWFKKTINAFLSTSHLVLSILMSRTPSTLANFLKLPDGGAPYGSWELKC
uniref:Uncharacterized protein n=1 Tax=Hyaloperonospora arabidopsidis (strain Emoy2) TaxID=559515 RepID=M4BC67_HYAAE